MFLKKRNNEVSISYLAKYGYKSTNMKYELFGISKISYGHGIL